MFKYVIIFVIITVAIGIIYGVANKPIKKKNPRITFDKVDDITYDLLKDYYELGDRHK